MINIDARIENADWPKRTKDTFAYLVQKWDPKQPRDTKGQWAKTGTVHVGGRDVTVVLPLRAKKAGDKLVPLDVAAFDAEFQRQTGFYLGKGGTGGIGNRYENFGNFIRQFDSIEAAEVSVQENGSVGFTNGRHRYAWLRDHGVTTIPVAMTPESVRHATRHGYLAAVKWDEVQHPRDKEGQFTEREAFIQAAIRRGEGHTVSESEFLAYHYTGHIPSNAYEKYEAGDLDFIHRGDFQTLLDTREVNGKTVEIRLQAEPTTYSKRTVAAPDAERNRLYEEYEQEAKRLGTSPMMAGLDLGWGSEPYKALQEFEKRWRASGEDFVRDEHGNAVQLTQEEMHAKGLPTVSYTVGAFVGDKAIGYAGDEFGASGVYLAREYQRHGLGLTLFKTYLEKSGRLATGGQIGQMTHAGEELVRALHRQLVKEHQKVAQEHAFGNTQIQIDPHSSAAATLNAARAAIKDEDLAGDGKDVDPNHLTVRYGLVNDDLDGLRTFIASQTPFEAQVIGIELFPVSEHSEGAVPVVARIASADLRVIEKEIGHHADFKEKSFPVYKPHCTIAYCKPEAAEQYKDLYVDGSFVVHGITISHASGVKETIPFGMAVKRWTESLHPRQPGGSSRGGEFVHGPRDALESLLHGEKHVNIDRHNVRKFLERAGRQHEDPDLTDLQVEGMEIFGGNGLGIKREDMPQIPREHRQAFLEMLQAEGVRITEEYVDPLTLKPTQNEISARRVAEKLEKYEQGNKAFPPVLVSNQNRILDGHHHWGMMAAFALEVPDARMPIFRIHLSTKMALGRMHAYMKLHGIKRESLAGVKKWDEQQHPRDKTGQFTVAGLTGHVNDVKTHLRRMFPDAEEAPVVVGIPKNLSEEVEHFFGAYDSSSGLIYVHPKMTDSAWVREQAKHQPSMVSVTPAGAVAHEFGHHLTNEVVLKRPELAKELADYADRWQIDDLDGKSKQATQSPQEFLAEAFADGYLNGEQASASGKFVYGLMQRAFGRVLTKKADSTGRYVTPFVSFDKQGDDQIRMIASLNSSRLATWGFTAEAEVLGMARYRITAVLDGRTSQFCRMINGKIFQTTEARRKVIECLNVQDPEDLKTVQPWPKQTKAAMAEWSKMSPEQLTERGLHIPPYHPYCRTLLRPIGSSEGQLTETVPTIPAPTEVFQPVTAADLEELGIDATPENVDQWNENIGMTPVELLSKLSGMPPREVMTKGQGIGANPVTFGPEGIGFKARGETPSGVEFRLGAILDPFTGTYYLTQADLLKGSPKAELAFLKNLFSSLIEMGTKSSATSIAVGVAGNAPYLAKLGFLPDDLDWESIRHSALSNLDLEPMLASLGAEDRLLVEHLLQDQSASALSALVELPFTYEGKTIGEWLLEDTTGTWALDLTDDMLVDQAKAYLS